MKKQMKVISKIAILVATFYVMFIHSVFAEPGHCYIDSVPNPIITPTPPYQLETPSPYASAPSIRLSGTCSKVPTKTIYADMLAYPTQWGSISQNGHDYVRDPEQSGIYTNARININGQFAYGDLAGDSIPIEMTNVTGTEGNYTGDVSFTVTASTSVYVVSVLPWPPYSMGKPSAYFDICPTPDIYAGGCTGSAIQPGNVPPTPAACTVNNGSAVNVQFPSAMASEFSQTGAPVTRLRKQVSISVACTGIPDQSMSAVIVADTNAFDSTSVATSDDNIGIQVTDSSNSQVQPGVGKIPVPLVDGNGMLNFNVTPVGTSGTLPSLGGYTSHAVIEIIFP